MPNTPDTDERNHAAPIGKSGDTSSATGDLAARIAKARRGGSGGNSGQSMSGDMRGASKAFRLATEFIAAIIVGALLGFAIDAGLGTTPWAMIVFLLVGFAAGVRNVIRVAADPGGAGEKSEPAGSLPDDEEED